MLAAWADKARCTGLDTMRTHACTHTGLCMCICYDGDPTDGEHRLDHLELQGSKIQSQVQWEHWSISIVGNVHTKASSLSFFFFPNVKKQWLTKEWNKITTYAELIGYFHITAVCWWVMSGCGGGVTLLPLPWSDGTGLKCQDCVLNFTNLLR